jgi:hypothetical protein
VTCEVLTPDVERESLPILFSLFFVLRDGGGVCIINKLHILPFFSFHYSYASLRILSDARFGHPFSLLSLDTTGIRTEHDFFFFYY